MKQDKQMIALQEDISMEMAVIESNKNDITDLKDQIKSFSVKLMNLKLKHFM